MRKISVVFTQSIVVAWLTAKQNTGKRKNENGSRRCSNVSRSKKAVVFLFIRKDKWHAFIYFYKTKIILNTLSQPVCIRSIGTAVPPHKISQERYHSILECANGMSSEEQLQLRKIYSRSRS